MQARSVTKDDFIEERIEQHQQQLNGIVKDRRPGPYEVANELFWVSTLERKSLTELRRKDF